MVTVYLSLKPILTLKNTHLHFRPILQFVAIKRGDTGEWALPGGMVDPGEKLSAAAIREFQEEAVNSFAMSEGNIKSKADFEVFDCLVCFLKLKMEPYFR